VSTLWSEAAKSKAISLAEEDLLNPKTVFVPERYSQSGFGSLFVTGKRIVLPSARTKVVDFISSGTGVIVANYEYQGTTAQILDNRSNALSSIMSMEDIAELTPEQKLRLIQAQIQVKWNFRESSSYYAE